jgi:glycosyltransferase involved in cell wall biosynthesis
MPDDPIVGIDASRSYRSPMTGTERYSRRIIEHLMHLDAEGLRYRLYFNEPPPAFANLGSAEPRVIPARRLWTHFRLSRELWQHPVDLLFVPSHVLPLYHPGRTIVTIHDLGYLVEPDSHTRSSRLQLKLTTQWNAREATRIVAISEATRRDLVTYLNVDPGRITVVPHGVDPQFRPVAQNEIERYRRAARLPERFILYLGTIQPRKNLSRLIEAFEIIAGEDPEISLILAGRTGWLSEPIREQARASRCGDRIRFLGYVPDEQLPLLYGTASAVALPSLYEGFGLPVLEAMACGTPVVMSNRGALPELAGADAEIIEPTDVECIAHALSNAVGRRNDPEPVEQRVAHAATFSWESSAAKTLSLVQEVMRL